MRLHRLIGPVFVVLCVTATLYAQNRSTRQITVAGVTNLSAQPGSAPTEIGNESRIATSGAPTMATSSVWSRPTRDSRWATASWLRR